MRVMRSACTGAVVAVMTSLIALWLQLAEKLPDLGTVEITADMAFTGAIVPVYLYSRAHKRHRGW